MIQRKSGDFRYGPSLRVSEGGRDLEDRGGKKNTMASLMHFQGGLFKFQLRKSELAFCSVVVETFDDRFISATVLGNRDINRLTCSKEINGAGV